MGSKLYFASGNKHKFQEIESLLNKHNIDIFSIADKQIVEPTEDGDSFFANALIKARYYGGILHNPVLADDSGIEIEYIDNKPGIYSSRWQKQLGSYSAVFKQIEQMLLDIGLSESPARFVCNIVLWRTDGSYSVFEGILPGMIKFPASGSQGFGYDPIFIPAGYDISLAQMSLQQKNQISHRYKALDKFISFYNE